MLPAAIVDEAVHSVVDFVYCALNIDDIIGAAAAPDVDDDDDAFCVSEFVSRVTHKVYYFI